MFYRKIIKYLNEWKEKKERKPLIIKGARQVGKTTAVKMFAKTFKQFIYFNLERWEEIKIFEDNKQFEKLVDAIFFYKDKEKDFKNTLLFLDEIQNSHYAIKSLRFFYEECHELFVVAAGSLFETAMSSEYKSFPVGRIEYLYMHPLSYSEYLKAIENKKLLNQLKVIPPENYAHQKLLNVFHVFAMIGGMPEIISNWHRNHDLVKLKNIYQSLIESYKDELEKYSKNQKERDIFRHIMTFLPYEVGKRIKYHGFGKSAYGSMQIKKALITLEKVMLINLIFPTTNYDIPIIPDTKKSPFLQFFDTGLINYQMDIQDIYISIDDLTDIFKGTLIRHIVNCEINNKTFNKNSDLAFWVREKKQSTAEIDLVRNYKGMVVPIEIKSGKTGTLRSLLFFMDNVNHHYAIRLYSGEFSIDNIKTFSDKSFKLMNLPYYYADQIDKFIDWFVENN